MTRKRVDSTRPAMFSLLLAVLVGSACSTAGCGKGSSTDPQLAAPQPDKPPPPTAAPREGLSESDKVRLIHKVKITRPEPGGMSIEKWVERQVANAGGPLLYSDWDVLPGDDGVHKVRFTYTWRSPSFQILNESLTWTIDADTDVVTGPLERMNDDENVDTAPEAGDTPSKDAGVTPEPSP